MMNVAHHHWVKTRFSKEKFKKLGLMARVFDDFVMVGAIFGPLATIPQIVQIWTSKNASGVSVVSWSGYFLGSFVWLVYGIIHKQKPIIVSNLLFAAFTFLIVLGTVIYGK